FTKSEGSEITCEGKDRRNNDPQEIFAPDRQTLCHRARPHSLLRNPYLTPFGFDGFQSGPKAPFSRDKLEVPTMATIHRRKTVTAVVGGVRVGSDAPVVVQSMTNTDTADVPSTVQQVADLARAGSELVRVTVNNEEAAAAVPRIVEQLDKQGVRVPIIGDFHYNGHQL